jgi:hypothetical protein
MILTYTVAFGGAVQLRPPVEGGHGMIQQLQINYNTNNLKQHDGDYLNARFALEKRVGSRRIG